MKKIAALVLALVDASCIGPYGYRVKEVQHE